MIGPAVAAIRDRVGELSTAEGRPAGAGVVEQVVRQLRVVSVQQREDRVGVGVHVAPLNLSYIWLVLFVILALAGATLTAVIALLSLIMTWSPEKGLCGVPSPGLSPTCGERDHGLRGRRGG
jgi:hypothetical protein